MFGFCSIRPIKNSCLLYHKKFLQKAVARLVDWAINKLGWYVTTQKTLLKRFTSLWLERGVPRFRMFWQFLGCSNTKIVVAMYQKVLVIQKIILFG